MEIRKKIKPRLRKIFNGHVKFWICEHEHVSATAFCPEKAYQNYLYQKMRWQEIEKS